MSLFMQYINTLTAIENFFDKSYIIFLFFYGRASVIYFYLLFFLRHMLLIMKIYQLKVASGKDS